MAIWNVYKSTQSPPWETTEYVGTSYFEMNPKYLDCYNNRCFLFSCFLPHLCWFAQGFSEAINQLMEERSTIDSFHLANLFRIGVQPIRGYNGMDAATIWQPQCHKAPILDVPDVGLYTN